MSQTKSLVMLAGAALTMGGAAIAEQAAWSANVDEVRALVAEMMSDAQTRSSLLQSGSTAGHDGKFFLASPDGNFRLNVSGQMQFRYYLSFLDDDTDGVDDFEPGFEMRRTKLTFAGNIFDPNMFYEVTGAFSRNDGDFALENAFFGYDWDNGFSARAGQFKLPFLREELVSSKYQLAVDRSVVNEEFNQDYAQGVELSYKKDWFGGYFAFSDGFGSDNTNFQADPADIALTARAEFLFAGDWSQFKDFTSQRGSEFAAMLGVAGHYERDPDNSGGPNAWFLPYTVDISIEGDGWNIYGAFVGQHSDNDLSGAAGVDADDFGFVLQGGFYFTDDMEFFARYDLLIPDGDRATDDNFNTITAGINYYLHGHAAKFTFDVAYYIDETTGSDLGNIGAVSANVNANGVATGGNTGIGMLGSTEEGQFTIRAQFQLLF